MLSNAATQSQRLSQLALLAAQSAHSEHRRTTASRTLPTQIFFAEPLLQAHAASGALAAVLPLLRPGGEANTPAVRAAAWHALTNAASHPDMYSSIGVGAPDSPGTLLRYAAEGLSAPARGGAELNAQARALAVLQNLAQREEGLQVVLALPAVLQAVGSALQAAAEQRELPAAERKRVALGALKVLTNSSCSEAGCEASAACAAAPLVAWMCAAVSDAGEVGGDATTAQVCPDTAERTIHTFGNWASNDSAWAHAAAAVQASGPSPPSALLALQRQVPEDEALLRKAKLVLHKLGCDEALL